MAKRDARFYKSPKVIPYIDSSMTYIETLHDETSARGAFLVEDQGELRVLKVAGPHNRRIQMHHREQDALEELSKLEAEGFPEVYGIWNSADNYDRNEPSATLVEYIAGEEFNKRARSPLVHARVKTIIRGLHYIGLGLPNDLGKNLRVKNGQPYLIDLEECPDLTFATKIADRTVARKDLLYENWFDRG